MIFKSQEMVCFNLHNNGNITFLKFSKTFSKVYRNSQLGGSYLKKEKKKKKENSLGPHKGTAAENSIN